MDTDPDTTEPGCSQQDLLPFFHYFCHQSCMDNTEVEGLCSGVRPKWVLI